MQKPVLPAVPSVMRPPSCSRPAAKASWMMCRATLSFTLPPGFRNSALATIYTTKVASVHGGIGYRYVHLHMCGIAVHDLDVVNTSMTHLD